MDGGAREVAVESLQLGLPPKDDVGGVLALGPMVCLIRVPSMRMLNRLPISPWNWGTNFLPRNVVTHLALELGDQLLTQKCGDVVRFDGMDGGAREVAVDSLQLGLPPKDDVGGVLA